MSFYPFDSFVFFSMQAMVPVLFLYWYCCVWPKAMVHQFLPKVWHGMSDECRKLKYHQHPPAYLDIFGPQKWNSSILGLGTLYEIFCFEEPMPEKEESVKEFVTRNLGEEVRKSLALAELLVVGDAPFFWAHKRFLVFCMSNIGVWGLTVVLCFPLF